MVGFGPVAVFGTGVAIGLLSTFPTVDSWVGVDGLWQAGDKKRMDKVVKNKNDYIICF